MTVTTLAARRRGGQNRRATAHEVFEKVCRADGTTKTLTLSWAADIGDGISVSFRADL